MKVLIKDFSINLEVKSSGIEFEIRTPDGTSQIGDCFLTMTGMVWCKGKTARDNGVKVSWDEFISLMQSQETLKAAVKAAKAASDPNKSS